MRDSRAAIKGGRQHAILFINVSSSFAVMRVGQFRRTLHLGKTPSDVKSRLFCEGSIQIWIGPLAANLKPSPPASVPEEMAAWLLKAASVALELDSWLQIALQADGFLFGHHFCSLVLEF